MGENGVERTGMKETIKADFLVVGQACKATLLQNYTRNFIFLYFFKNYNLHIYVMFRRVHIAAKGITPRGQ